MVNIINPIVQAIKVNEIIPIMSFLCVLKNSINPPPLQHVNITIKKNIVQEIETYFYLTK